MKSLRLHPLMIGRRVFCGGVAAASLAVAFVLPVHGALAQAAALKPGRAPTSKAIPPSRAQVIKNYGKLPLAFEANQGQTDAQVKFLSRGAGYTLFLTGKEAVLSLASRQSSVFSHQLQQSTAHDLTDGRPATTDNEPRTTNAILRMQLVGANPNAPVSGLDELPGKSSYFIGNDPKQWRTNVPAYARASYKAVYPGVDLVYYGNQGQLEYDFVVAPGADPRVISLSFVGARHISIDKRSGDLLLKAGKDEVRFHKPVVYQAATGHGPGTPAKTLLEGRYRLASGHRVSFEVASYDRRQPLVIDPALVFSTYLGGSALEVGSDIALDAAGNVYVAGYTQSTNFPATPGAYKTTCGTDGTCNGGLYDAFVTKFNPAGTALVYSTFLGGSKSDFANGLALDTSDNAYLAGQTFSTDFPVTPGVFQTACAQSCTNGNGFVTELNSTGSALLYSTYLGGGNDAANAISLDSSNDAYVFGSTSSSKFPVTAGAFQTTFGGKEDAFVTELNPTGTALLYSTFLGGSANEHGWGIAVDSFGDAFVVGQTNSTDFPVTPGAFQTTLNAMTAGFVTELNPTGTALVYSTFLGGSSTFTSPCPACATDVFVDSSGDAYVVGLTYETNFPVTPGAFQTTFGGGTGGSTAHDAFVTKLNSTGSALVYSTYLGGKADDGAVSLAVDGAGNAYFRGNTGSTNFPVTSNAFQSTCGGGCVNKSDDAFVSELDPTGSTLLYSTYLGGSANEFGHATRSLALNSPTGPNVYVTGYTDSTDFPVTTGAFQTVNGGLCDAFVTEFAPLNATALLSPSSLTFPVQLVGTSTVTQTVTLTNSGQATLDITSVSITGTNSGDFSQTDTCGTSVAAFGTCTISVTFTPTAINSRTGTLSVADSAAGSSPTVSLSGTGTVVRLSPTKLSFGSVKVGMTSAPKTVTLTNTGTTALSITTIKLTGTNPGDFGETNTCGTSVAAGASCTISVTFKPTATGQASAGVSISDGGGGNPQKVTLSGTGT